MTDRPGWEVENELAESYGWTPERDLSRGPEWCLFRKGKEAIWSCYPSWARATKEEGTYHKPEWYPSLKDAIEKTNQRTYNGVVRARNVIFKGSR